VIEKYVRRGADARARHIVTPEGVELSFTLAGAGDRAAAFVLDMLFMIVAIIAIAIAAELAGGGPWMSAFLLIVAFVIRNFYFVVFETRWQGLTPGKRIVGIRVVDARGGQLEAGAILGRNLIREIEVWQPLAFLLAGGDMWPDAPSWAKIVSGGWLFVFLLMPLFNRDRLRIGDMLGGTRVVVQPKPLLLPDLADAAVMPQLFAPGFSHAETKPMFPFKPEQLDHYGIYELQVLEGVLRGGGDGTTMAHVEAMATVAQKIHLKISYHVPVRHHQYERFLRDFYTALRAHLEKKMLFGQRREDKHAAAQRGAGASARWRRR
jgi:uncharacterized RDD family membrane protein YckC